MVSTQAVRTSSPAVGRARQLLVWLAPFCLYGLVLAAPIPGQVGEWVRYGFDLGLLAIGGLLYLTLKLKGEWGKAASLALLLVLFGLALDGLWANALSEMQVLGGMIFFSDSAHYSRDIQNLLLGGSFSAFSARHPVAPVLLAVLLGLCGHHLQIALAIQTAMVTTCIYAAGREVDRRYGAAAGAVFWLLLCLFYRRFTGLLDCENIGIGLGALSFAALLRGAVRREQQSLGPGLFLQGLAHAARPGGLLVLPALAGWMYTIHTGRRQKSRAMILSAAALALPFAVQSIVWLSTGGTGGTYSNYAYTLYGIATGGKGWEQFRVDHPQYTRLPESEGEQEAARLAINMILSDPRPAFNAAGNAYADFLSTRNSSAYGWMSGGELTALDRRLPENSRKYQIVRGITWGLAILGFIYLLKKPRQADSWLLLWVWLGILASVPLAPPQDAGMMRAYGAAIPFLAVLPAVGTACLSPRPGEDGQTASEPAGKKGYGLAAVCAGLALVLLAGPVLLRGQAPAQPAGIACPESMIPAEMWIWPGSYLHIRAVNTGKGHVPDIDREQFQRAVEQFPHREMIAPLADLEGEMMMVNGLNLQNRELVWLAIRGYQQEWSGKRTAVCGRWEAEVLKNGMRLLVVNAGDVSIR